MVPASLQDKAHELIGQLGEGQLSAVVHLLKVMVDDEDDQLTEDDRQAIADGREYFRQNPEGGISFEQMVADCGFTMDQVRQYKTD